MPITKSAKKSLRVSLRQQKENSRVRKLLKEAIRKSSKERLPEVFSAIDKAVKFGIIHRNKAARLKGRFATKFGVISKPGVPKKQSRTKKRTKK